MKNSTGTILKYSIKFLVLNIPEYTIQQFHGLKKYLMQELKELYR